MKKNNVQSDIVLGLLDDQCLSNDSSVGLGQLTREKCTSVTRASTSSVPTASPTSAVANRPAPATTKVFRTKSSLRDMMQQYNRPQVRPSAPVSRTQSGDFLYERIEFIEIPCIPGKILRPATPNDADA